MSKTLDYIALIVVFYWSCQLGTDRIVPLDLVRLIFGDMTWISRIIYVLVGNLRHLFADISWVGLTRRRKPSKSSPNAVSGNFIGMTGNNVSAVHFAPEHCSVQVRMNCTVHSHHSR